MKYIILGITLLSFYSRPAYANPTNTIYVKRESKPSLLDRKFVFRQVQSTATQAPETNLKAMNQELRTPAQKPTAAKSKLPAQTKLQTTPGSNNWDDFAVETEVTESQEVSAKLIH